MPLEDNHFHHFRKAFKCIVFKKVFLPRDMFERTHVREQQQLGLVFCLHMAGFSMLGQQRKAEQQAPVAHCAAGEFRAASAASASPRDPLLPWQQLYHQPPPSGSSHQNVFLAWRPQMPSWLHSTRSNLLASQIPFLFQRLFSLSVLTLRPHYCNDAGVTNYISVRRRRRHSSQKRRQWRG